MGHDFDRQRPIDQYIVDFYCKDLMMAIEIDGESHRDTLITKNDIIRQKTLEKLGVRVLRIDDQDIKDDIDEVLLVIQDFIKVLENRFQCRK